jgi:hypothetical protein
VLRKLSLQKRILILVTSATILTMTVIVGFDSYSLRKSVEETYVSQLNGITIAINGRYEESHSVKDVQQIFDYIQYKNKNVIKLTLYGDNAVRASTDRASRRRLSYLKPFSTIGRSSPTSTTTGTAFRKTGLRLHSRKTVSRSGRLNC